MMAFNGLTTLDHCRLLIDIKTKAMIKDKIKETKSPFSRKLQSNYPKTVRQYKRHLKHSIEKYEL